MHYSIKLFETLNDKNNDIHIAFTNKIFLKIL